MHSTEPLILHTNGDFNNFFNHTDWVWCLGVGVGVDEEKAQLQAKACSTQMEIFIIPSYWIRLVFARWYVSWCWKRKTHSTDLLTHVAHKGDFIQNGFCVFVDDEQARTALMNWCTRVTYNVRAALSLAQDAFSVLCLMVERTAPMFWHKSRFWSCFVLGVLCLWCWWRECIALEIKCCRDS